MTRMLRQAFLAILACSAMFASSSSACLCSHHHVKKKVVESDCHSLHHVTTQEVETESDGDFCDTSCVCIAEQSSPLATSKAPTKEFKANDVAKAAEFLPENDFVRVTAFNKSSPSFLSDLSYSSTLKSLLPARAPPRL